MKKIALAILILLFSTALYAQPFELAGDWEGYISGPRRHLNITLHFIQKDDSLTGTIDIQGANLPLQQTRITDKDSVFFEFVTPVNVAKFEGIFKNDSTITGQYHQAGYSFPFELSRVEGEVDSTSNQAPLPYKHKDLIIHNDSVKIAGTLIWPKGQPTQQLVITLSGSGAQNRDGANPITDFEPYVELARGLTEKGIAVFRYDDRGVGKSSGSLGNATLAMLVSDVEAIMKYFKSSHDSTPTFQNMILLGHSQGGIIAGKVAAENKTVKKIILVASPGVSLKKVLHYQVKRAFNRTSLPEALINKEIVAREKLMAAVVNEQNIDKVREAYHKIFAKVQRIAGLDSSRAARLAKVQAQKLAEVYSSPHVKSFLFYKPTEDLKQLNIPVLVLFGGKDTQVPVGMNKKPIKQALEKAEVSYKIKVFPKANHLFQKAKTGSFWEYDTLKNQFVDGFLRTISEWIKK